MRRAVVNLLLFELAIAIAVVVSSRSLFFTLYWEVSGEHPPNRSNYSSQNEMAVEKHQRKKKELALKKLQIM